jgi:alpha-ketoglutarate-dependent taurine dioxygenase
MVHCDGTVLPVLTLDNRGAVLRTADLADTRSIWMTLREHGAVLLKGAASSAAAFDALTEPFAEHFRIHQDPTRRGYNAADTTQSVTAGEDAIGLHAERAYMPGRPEMLFFCCITPPVSGGATTLCDGAAVVDRLSADDVRALDALMLMWRVTLEPQRWQRLWHTDDPAVASACFDEALTRHGEQMQTKHWFDGDGTLQIEYLTPSLTLGRISRQKSFANYLLLAAEEPGGPSATQADGAPIPLHLLRRVAALANALTIDIEWDRGDVVLIDNMRCLHGRRAFAGGPREILTRMGDARLPAG